MGMLQEGCRIISMFFFYIKPILILHSKLVLFMLLFLSTSRNISGKLNGYPCKILINLLRTGFSSVWCPLHASISLLRLPLGKGDKTTRYSSLQGQIEPLMICLFNNCDRCFKVRLIGYFHFSSDGSKLDNIFFTFWFNFSLRLS